MPSDAALDMTRGFLLGESGALKKALSGMKVPGRGGNTRDVKVWFRWPQEELRDRTFPYITISFVDILRAGNREHRGHPNLGYTPFIYEEIPGGVGRIEYPIPYDLLFQVTVHTRNNLDLLIIKRQIFTEIFPERYSGLKVDDDDTTRTIFYNGSSRSTGYRDENGNRLFQTAFGYTVYSEVPPPVESVIKSYPIETIIANLFVDHREQPPPVVVSQEE